MAEAAAQTVLDRISQGHLECPICCCRFKDPKILDCLHSFCLNCLEEMMSKQKSETEKITCPVCRRETQVSDGGLQSLSSSFFLISLADEINKQEQILGKALSASTTCESCVEGHDAVSRCLDCKANFCKTCQEAHQGLKYTKDHCIIPAHESDEARVLATNISKTFAPKCRKHIEQSLCFRCETCDTLICSMCAATEHRSAEHNFIGITDAIESFRKGVNDMLQKFEKSKEQFASNTNSIKHARNRLQKKLAQARSDISAKAEAEIAKIRNKAKLLTEKVDEIGQERDSEYEKALTHNHDQMERADQIVTAVNDLMRQADDFELLELRSKVMRNLEFQKDLKCEPLELDVTFIEVRCQDVVCDKDLGKILFKEKWQVKEKFGKEGNRDGEFQFSRGVACFSNGDIAVTDTELKRLSIFTCTGQFKTSAAQKGHQLDAPWGVAVTPDDLLFVTDKKTVKVFDDNIQLVREFTPSHDGASDLSAIAVDTSADRLVVADSGRKLVSVHLLDGSLVTTIPNENVGVDLGMNNMERLFIPNYDQKTLSCVDLKGNEVFNIKTLVDGNPANPTGVLCDGHGYINVALHHGNRGTFRVQQYDPNGSLVGTVAENLYNPLEMASTPNGDVVVADKHTIKIFQWV